MKKIISTISALSLLMSGMVYAEGLTNEEANIVYYVATNGKDGNSGTIDAPLKTIEEAQKRVRANKKKGSKEIEVIIRGGEYRFTKSLNLTELDTASAKAPVTYKAMEGEEVIFKGSKEFTGKSMSPVTDPAILSRVRDNVKNKLVKIDLAAEGFTPNEMWDNSEFGVRIQPMHGDNEVNMLYIDDTEQMLSQWPNGKGVYTVYDKAVDSFTINYIDSEPSKWTKAKDWWVAGFLDYDWRYSRGTGVNIDPQKKTLTISSLTSGIGFTSYQSKRWKAYNLLEEIDVPGEFYIDVDNMNLYFYPPYTLKDARLELSVMTTPIIEAKNASHIKFEGITFCQSRGYGVRMTDVRDIDFTGCTFKDILIDAIYIKGSKTAVTDSTYWQVLQNDASYDCDIKDNVFFNLGGAAVDMCGGNVDTLEKSNNVIENNFISEVAWLTQYRNTVSVRGCGNIVRNNNISRAVSSAIYYTGNDNTFEYNEIYNVIQQHDDAGAIYCGRNILHQGNVIAYNYIHDMYSTDKLPFGHQCAIYWDDGMVGQTAHHNIFRDVKKDHYTNGVGNVFKDNLSINIQVGVLDVKNGGPTRNTTAGGTGFGSVIADTDLYYSRYPNLKTLIPEMANGNTPEMARYSTYQGNLAVNSAANMMGTNMLTHGKVKNNVNIEGLEDFVNPDKQDYRLKSGSKTAKSFPNLLDETFDIEQIGMKSEAPFNEENRKFKQLYPENGSSAVSVNKLDFVWQESFGATKYHLVVATDRELKDVVFEEDCYYTAKRVDGLLPGKTYFWKVYAMNTSREFAAEWESESPVYTFKTALYERLDTENFNMIVENVQNQAETIVEGSKPGDYLPGTVSGFQKLVKKSKIALNARLGIFEQKNLDTLAERLGTYFERRGLVNKGFVDIGASIKEEGVWSCLSDNLKIDGDTLTFESDADKQGTVVMGTKGFERMTGSVIYSFTGKMKVGKNFIDMGINKSITAPPWTPANPGYSLVIKPNVIELQYTTGTEGGVLTTVDYSLDDKEHQFDFGFIDIGVGAAIIFRIDGEPIIEYRDVKTAGVNAMCNFAMLIYNQGEASVMMKPAKTVHSREEFAEIEKNNTYSAAKDLIDSIDSSFTARSEFVIMKDGGGKILTEEKAIDVSDAKTYKSGDKFYVPAEKVADFIPVTTKKDNSSMTVTSTVNNMSVTVPVTKNENGIEIVSISDILAGLSVNYVYDNNTKLFIIGDIIIMNNPKTLGNLTQLMDMLDAYGDKEDVVYHSVKQK